MENIQNLPKNIKNKISYWIFAKIVRGINTSKLGKRKKKNYENQILSGYIFQLQQRSEEG